jgi:2,5-diketo-D-gluconate reductase A
VPIPLYLIHWPTPQRDLYVESWTALEQIKADGRARSIGVSNFLVEYLERLARESETVPAINQVELHPAHQRPELTAYHREHGIVTEAWGPLGQGKYPLFEVPEVVTAADAHERTPAQVVLRWHLQNGFVVFPKSNSRERIAQNFALFDFELTTDEMAAIDGLERAGRVGGDPREIN